MTSTTTRHDIQPYAVERDGMASARCYIHMTTTTERWATMGQAARGFICDEGHALRFITEFHGEDLMVTPVMRDLSSLARTIRQDMEDLSMGQVYGETRAWQWHGDGRAEALRVKLVSESAFDETDYAWQTWQVTGEDGRVVAEIPVRIDGRS